MKVLVIGAHPDDPVLGCGGTICKHVEDGDEVYVCIVSVASSPEWDDAYRDNKLIEQEKVDKFLGIERRYNLNFPVLEMNTIPKGRFNIEVATFISKLNPDIIYTHFNKDLNEQHNLVSVATIVGARAIFTQCKILMYEGESTRFSLESFKPNYFVNIKDYIGKKLQAFSFYESEVREAPHPRSLDGILTHAKYRGNDVNLEYAEAFMLVREVIK